MANSTVRFSSDHKCLDFSQSHIASGEKKKIKVLIIVSFFHVSELGSGVPQIFIQAQKCWSLKSSFQDIQTQYPGVPTLSFFSPPS